MLSFGCSVTIGETINPLPASADKISGDHSEFWDFYSHRSDAEKLATGIFKSARVGKKQTKHIFRLFGLDSFVPFSLDGSMGNAVMCCKSKTTLHTKDRRFCECNLTHARARAAFSPHRRFTFICTICNVRFFFLLRLHCLSIRRCSVFCFFRSSWFVTLCAAFIRWQFVLKSRRG